MTTPATQKRRETVKRKNEMMTQFLRDFEKFSNRRVTMDLIQSQPWIVARDMYIKLFNELMERTK